MRFALIGQPNCGKSTLFNQVAGYKAETGNFSGTTVTYTESKVRVAGQVIELVDLPGTYTLTGTNPAERETLFYLASHQVDVIINVVDASNLAQGLCLTLELLELCRPMVIALNMMDEAARLGMVIDGPKLQELLGAPVLPLVASKGRGVRNLFVTAVEVGTTGKYQPVRPGYRQELEDLIQTLGHRLEGKKLPFNPYTSAIKLLEGNPALLNLIKQDFPEVLPYIEQVKEALGAISDEEPSLIFIEEREQLAAQLTAAVLQRGERRISLRDRLDDVLLHPVWGYLSLIVILFAFFESIYGIGSALEKPLLAVFNQVELILTGMVGTGSLSAEILTGLLQGIAGGVAIVLPYLVPFLAGLGLLEDVGYLPRMAFLMDALMHRMGLHGKAIVPFILGYGCNVPAVMSTRVLEDRRDRFLAAALSTMVPCAARLAVVFGLVAFYLGPRIALGIYLFNLIIIAFTGRILSGLMPEVTPGMILEMPIYRVPTLRTIVLKVWFRVREFIVEAWPVLILGSVILSLLKYYAVTGIFNLVARPITWILGLPIDTGVPLIFGILRKELSLIMLRQALGVANFTDALSSVQMITFTIFVVFYIPCLATLVMLRRELGTREMLMISAITIVIATLAALVGRGVAWVILERAIGSAPNGSFWFVGAFL